MDQICTLFNTLSPGTNLTKLNELIPSSPQHTVYHGNNQEHISQSLHDHFLTNFHIVKNSDFKEHTKSISSILMSTL